MKKPNPSKAHNRSTKAAKPLASNQSAAAQELGGQPENDEDAQAAGFDSATSAAQDKAPSGRPEKFRPAPRR